MASIKQFDGQKMERATGFELDKVRVGKACNIHEEHVLGGETRKPTAVAGDLDALGWRC